MASAERAAKGSVWTRAPARLTPSRGSIKPRVPESSGNPRSRIVCPTIAGADARAGSDRASARSQFGRWVIGAREGRQVPPPTAMRAVRLAARCEETTGGTVSDARARSAFPSLSKWLDFTYQPYASAFKRDEATRPDSSAIQITSPVPPTLGAHQRMSVPAAASTSLGRGSYVFTASGWSQSRCSLPPHRSSTPSRSERRNPTARAPGCSGRRTPRA